MEHLISYIPEDKKQEAVDKYNVKVIQDIADAICLGEHACNPKEKAKVKTDSRTEYAPISWE